MDPDVLDDRRRDFREQYVGDTPTCGQCAYCSLPPKWLKVRGAGMCTLVDEWIDPDNEACEEWREQ